MPRIGNHVICDMRIAKDCKHTCNGHLDEWAFYPTANSFVQHAICHACLDIICRPELDQINELESEIQDLKKILDNPPDSPGLSLADRR